MEWNEYRIFIYDRQRMDNFVFNILPLFFCKADISTFFFLRYWESGPHLRLRVPQSLGDQRENLGTIIDPLPDFVPDLSRYEERRRLSKGATMRALMPDKTVLSVPYQPETFRYGTGQDLRDNESLFSTSSALTLRLGRKFRLEEARLRLAADIILVTFKRGAEVASLGEIVDTYARLLWGISAMHGPLPDYKKLADRLVGKMGVARLERLSELSAWDFALKEFCDGVRASHLFSTHTHLFMNRLGVTPRQEAYLLKILLER